MTGQKLHYKHSQQMTANQRVRQSVQYITYSCLIYIDEIVRK